MLTGEAEEILRLEFRANVPLSLLHVFKTGHFVKIVGRPMLGGDDPKARARYVATLEELVAGGLVHRTGRETFELTAAGRDIARSLVEEMDAETAAPDSCTFLMSGTRVRVCYRGLSGDAASADEYRIPPGVVKLQGTEREGHAAGFDVEREGTRDTFYVLWFGLELPWEPHRERNVIAASDLTTLLKRPGLRAVRDHLRGKLAPIEGNVLPFPHPSEDSPAPATLRDYMERVDDRRAEVLLDCERDVLSILLADRGARKTAGVTAVEIARSSAKRRFYSIRDHIRQTLADLAEKNLIQTEDAAHYVINSRKLADARRVVAGLPSERLFDAPPAPGPLTARVPPSTGEFDVFLCYASEDAKAAVEPAARALEKLGLKVWWQKGRIAWGENLVRKIHQGLSRSRLAVVFLTDAFLARPMSEAELSAALSMRTGERPPVLSLILGLTLEEFQARFPEVTPRSHREIPNYYADLEIPPEELDALASDIQRLVGVAG